MQDPNQHRHGGASDGRSPDGEPAVGCPPMGRFGWYRRFHAWVLHAYADRYNALVDDRKRRLIGGLRGAVLEIGAGSGANLPYYDRSVRWTALEPNAEAHAYLREKAAAHGLAATVVAGAGQAIPLPDGSQDAVVSTLVLCTVPDPAKTLAEVLRVLKPGGRFVFVEHVGAERGSARRRRQELVKPAWRWLADGCEPDRDTADRIAAAGFRDVDIERFLMPYPVVGPHIAGSAVK